ncbi:MAG TPA: DNA-formamidopyrimidine glycosylase family protein [Propionibacteriaceae bacterium]|nr:DNA-formamidopyrimidine glycosylase family protein [Propionibacteriaceae bacterium]
MPEGDSVYQTARRLDAALVGGVLEVADLRWPSLATADLTGDTTLEVVSRGKHILHRLSSGRTLHSHLKMEGRWRVRPREKGQRWGDPSVRAVLATRTAAAVGTRLGALDLVATRDEHTLVGHLGPDLLGPDWDSDAAVSNLAAHPDAPVAAALLDQRNLAGLGTVYVAETLFLQRLSPWTPVGDIAPERLAGTVARAHTLLSANKDTYARTITGSRVEGQQDYVHGRSGQPCRRCGTTVEVAPLDGTQRVVFYCRTCQQGPFPAATAQRPLGAAPRGPETRRVYRTGR